MKNRVFIATFSEGAIEVSRSLGLGLELNDLCISENLDREKRAATMAQMREEIRQARCDDEAVIAHGPFTEIIPASIDHRAVEMGLERLREAWEVIHTLGINRMVVHTGYVPALYFPKWHLEKSEAFWKTYMADKPKDFYIYIENVFEDRPELMKELIERIDDPRVRICLDVGHANAVMAQGDNILRWIEVLGPLIGHLHLHNNDGSGDQHGALTAGTMDMAQVLQAIRRYCPEEVTMTIESRQCRDSAMWLLETMGIYDRMGRD